MSVLCFFLHKLHDADKSVLHKYCTWNQTTNQVWACLCSEQIRCGRVSAVKQSDVAVAVRKTMQLQMFTWINHLDSWCFVPSRVPMMLCSSWCLMCLSSSEMLDLFQSFHSHLDFSVLLVFAPVYLWFYLVPVQAWSECGEGAQSSESESDSPSAM